MPTGAHRLPTSMEQPHTQPANCGLRTSVVQPQPRVQRPATAPKRSMKQSARTSHSYHRWSICAGAIPQPTGRVMMRILQVRHARLYSWGALREPPKEAQEHIENPARTQQRTEPHEQRCVTVSENRCPQHTDCHHNYHHEPTTDDVKQPQDGTSTCRKQPHTTDTCTRQEPTGIGRHAVPPSRDVRVAYHRRAYASLTQRSACMVS